MTQAIEDSKVYYPETIEDEPLPDQIQYSQIVGAPQSVTDLNPVDGDKLNAIEYNGGDPYWINDIINERIDTASKNILADWNFGDEDYAGGVYAGDISWSTANGAVTGGSGVVLNRNGLLGAKSGVTTFTIDATTGDATFSGDVTGATITGGSITGTTITGGTIRTDNSGARVQMLESTNTLQILDSSGNVRAESFQNGWEFNNSSENTRGRVFVENTFGNLQLQATAADLFLTAASDIAFAPGNGSISMYIDASSKDLVMNSGDIQLGNTTIRGGGSWTMTLPSNNGSPGEVLHTDGGGDTYWDSITGGANTSLSNLSSVAINTDLEPGSSALDIGQSINPWDRIYVDDIYLTNGDGGIYYSGTLALDFYASHLRLGSGYDDFSPSSFLGGNLGDTFRWNAVFCDSIDVSGTVDADRLRFSTGEDISASGSDIDYDADSDHIFYINSTLKAIIDDNIFTEGDLLANGTKPFLIPHPDGSDRLLRYTAQESPEVLLRHRGVGLTAGKKVTINLPKHFRLVTDPTGTVTVNLTPVGDHHVYLEQEPSNGEINVGSNEPNVKFHYEVIAIRSGFKDRPVELEQGDETGLVEKMKSIPDKTAAIKDRKGKLRQRRAAAIAERSSETKPRAERAAKRKKERSAHKKTAKTSSE